MIPYDYIQTSGELESLVARLTRARCARLAVDVEGENNLHSYGIHVALIQLFDGSRGYAVDALAIQDAPPMKALLEHVPWVLVWFDAANDLLSFQHALGIHPSPILDVAIAARMLGRTGGLASLTSSGASASAKDKFQKSNWLRRPLSRALLDYAISDVVHLLDLADELMAELEGKGLMAEFQARNLAAQDAERAWNPLANFTRIPGYNRLHHAERRFAKRLWYAREYYGRQHDLPPGNVASKQDMRSIVDRGLRDPESIVRFLNERRKRNLIVPGDFAARFGQAEKDVGAEETEAGRIDGGRGTR
jgi:ribonuclease D